MINLIKTFTQHQYQYKYQYKYKYKYFCCTLSQCVFILHTSDPYSLFFIPTATHTIEMTQRLTTYKKRLAKPDIRCFSNILLLQDSGNKKQVQYKKSIFGLIVLNMV